MLGVGVGIEAEGLSVGLESRPDVLRHVPIAPEHGEPAPEDLREVLCPLTRTVPDLLLCPDGLVALHTDGQRDGTVEDGTWGIPANKKFTTIYETGP